MNGDIVITYKSLTNINENKMVPNELYMQYFLIQAAHQVIFKKIIYPH